MFACLSSSHRARSSGSYGGGDIVFRAYRATPQFNCLKFQKGARMHFIFQHVFFFVLISTARSHRSFAVPVRRTPCTNPLAPLPVPSPLSNDGATTSTATESFRGGTGACDVRAATTTGDGDATIPARDTSTHRRDRQQR